MAKDNLRTCAVCRSLYKYCSHCAEFKDKPLYYYTFCSDNCHDIYAVICGYKNGKLKAKDAKKRLDKLDLSRLSEFGESYQNAIAEILICAADTKIVENLTTTEDNSVNEIVDENSNGNE